MNLAKKNILLIIGFILLLGISYQAAFVKTIALLKEHRGLTAQEKLRRNIPKQLIGLNRQNAYCDSLLAKYRPTKQSFQNRLLKTINIAANTYRLKLTAFYEPHLFFKKNLRLNTSYFTLQGNYTDIIRLVYGLEQHHEFGNVVSVAFEKKKNHRKKTTFLNGTIFLQHITR